MRLVDKWKSKRSEPSYKVTPMEHADIQGMTPEAAADMASMMAGLEAPPSSSNLSNPEEPHVSS